MTYDLERILAKEAIETDHDIATKSIHLIGEDDPSKHHAFKNSTHY